MRSGKDTVANMWQFLSDKSAVKNNLDFNSWIKYPFVAPQWEIKKFATGVKEVASILTSIPLHELEKDTAKEIVLPRHWNTLISEDDEITLTKVMTVRELFQKIGTDAIRDNVHPDAWVNTLMTKYVPESRWVISDVRFPNETRAIKRNRGMLIRVLRPCIECGLMNAHKMSCSVGLGEHQSETALDGYDKWDYVIYNDGDIYKLLSNVNRIYNQLMEAGRI